MTGEFIHHDNRQRDLDRMYQDIILDHQQSPRNYGKLEKFDCRAEGFNPMCGDRIALNLKFSADQKHLTDQRFTGEACSICMASASMMTEEISGKSVVEILEKIKSFREAMQSKDDGSILEGDMLALAGVKRFPVRIKCALLPWTTLKDAIEKGCAAVRRLTNEDDQNGI